MIQSELLKEKYRIQKILSAQSPSAHEYLIRSQLAAKTIANSFGFSLQYVEMSNNRLQRKIGGRPRFADFSDSSV